eukprot:jgi/Chrzof1/12835/Cz07g09030.t1
MQSMYIRVKRQKLTIFLQVDASDTVLEVKQKLQPLIEQPPEKVQLVRDDAVLDDAKKLVDLKVENDDVVAMCYQQEDGSFEPVNITRFETAETDTRATVDANNPSHPV